MGNNKQQDKTIDSEKVIRLGEKQDINKEIQYNDKEIEAFLDSIGEIDPEPLMTAASYYSDSLFLNRPKLNKTISQVDFEGLKSSAYSGMLNLEMAARIFDPADIDTSYISEGKIPVEFYSFDQDTGDFKHFAFNPGNSLMSWDCNLYFFHSSHLLSKHYILHKYGLEPGHFRDDKGQTVVYYKQNYVSGTGIWQFNFYFYQYRGNELVPILNEIENGNLHSWGLRNFWIESFIVKTDPLTLKMVFYQSFPGETEHLRFVDDSTIVHYDRDPETGMYSGKYQDSKISKEQVLSYYFGDIELLFIHAYYPELKKCLEDTVFRKPTLDYLNWIKNVSK